MRPESEMVSSNSSGSTADLDDITSENDVIFDAPSSTSNKSTLCPHCNFRADSPTQMTQHSWNVHPLLMRRKKHLITSRKNEDEKRNEICETIHNDLDMQKCSLQSNSPKRDILIHNGTNMDEERRQANYGPSPSSERAELDSRATVTMPTHTFSQNLSPHRHVAIVRPIPNEQQHHVTMTSAETPAHFTPEQQNNIQQQSLKLLSQPAARDQLVYAPMFNVLIPGLNQYVTIPIPVGGIPHGKYPTGALPQSINSHQHNSYNANFSGRMHAQTQKHVPLPTGGNADFIDYETIRERLLGKPEKFSPPKVNEVKPFNHSSQQLQDKSSIETGNNICNKPAKCGVPPGQNFEQIQRPAKQESLCNEKGAFPSPNVPSPSQPQKIEPMCAEKLQALENALRSTDCCGIEDKSTTMPFQCPDGIWRMVTFKCIRGVWLVNIPGSSTPTIYVPCDSKKKSASARLSPISPQNGRKFQTGDKRRLSDPVFRTSLEVDAKRLCASTPNMSLQTAVSTQTTAKFKRTLSDPELSSKLPQPRQHFVSSEGKKMNISVVKRVPSASSSDSLIRSLLLRKPSPSNDAMMTSLNEQHAACMMAADRHITHQLSNINHSPMNNDAMAY